MGAGDARRRGAGGRGGSAGCRPAAATADAGAGRAVARRRRIRCDGQPRVGRSEGQADRHAMARHARRGRSVPAFLIHSEDEARSQVAATRRDFRALRALLGSAWLLCAGAVRGAGPAREPGAGDRAGLAGRYRPRRCRSELEERRQAVPQCDHCRALGGIVEGGADAAGRRFRNARRLARNSTRAFQAHPTASMDRPLSHHVCEKLNSRETVTLEHEPDGAWRVIGYLIQ